MTKNIIRVTKKFSFEMAHALYNYDGKCKHIHGHSYKLYVTLRGDVKQDTSSPKDGMVIDFTILKEIVVDKIVNIYDHALVINENDERKSLFIETDSRTIIFPVQPTCENLLIHFKNTISENLPENLTVVNVKLYETEDSFAEWDINDQ